ncbi:MAG: caspase family protein [Saprospiraceae bacterium]|nr:caspase family protein [Saprospiraceae bacterium]
MRKALIVGINHYESEGVPNLYGCVNDAYEVKRVLNRDGDGTINFEVLFRVATEAKSKITRKQLKSDINELFEGKPEVALFYFSGHGYIENTGGYMVTSECKDGDDGLSMNELLQIANDSGALNKIIILDCCHSGVVGKISPNEDKSILSEGMTILTASSPTQYAMEKNGYGVFTSLFVDALDGASANLLGEITPGSVYAHIDKSLGSFGQRPIFKTNVVKFVSLRKVQPAISIDNLMRITTLFPNKSEDFKLDPTYEPERSGNESKEIPPPNEEHTEDFDVLQKYNRLNLVVPVDAPHMWHAAMHSKSCKLTVLGEFYWDLVKNGRI